MAQFARPAAMLYEIVRHALCWLATRPTIELHFALVCLIYTWLEWVWTRNGSKILYYLSYVFRDTSKPENPKLENLNRLLRSPLSIKLLYMYCISLYCIVHQLNAQLTHQNPRKRIICHNWPAGSLCQQVTSSSSAEPWESYLRPNWPCHILPGEGEFGRKQFSVRENRRVPFAN